MHLGTLTRIAVGLLAVTTSACSPGLFTAATTIQTPRGAVTAILGEGDDFPRFDMPDHGSMLADAPAAEVADDCELLILRRGDCARALLVDEMAWHHVAQGTLGGVPTAVVYCVVCDVAVGLTPEVDGRPLHVSAGGVSNGVVMLRDAETGSYWNSLTGEALAGPLAGKSMTTFSIGRMRVAEARAEGRELELLRSPIGTYGRVWSRGVSSFTRTPEGYIPGFFRRSFDRQDPRRPERELGLGVVAGGRARFYPACELNKCATPVVDALGGSSLVIDHDDLGLGHAQAVGAAVAPFAVWGRWYGFSASFPDCEVWTSSPAGAVTSAEPTPANEQDVTDRGVAQLRTPCMDR